MSKLSLTFFHGTKTESKDVEVRDLIIAGWTARDARAMEEHIAELEAIGVQRPKATPCFYRVSASLLTTDPSIQALGRESSGEVEYFLLKTEEGLWVGVGSDHTDRKLESYDVGQSKQACAKPIGRSVWRYDEVVDHWDRLTLTAFATVEGERCTYQSGPVASMLHPMDLIERYEQGGSTFGPGTVMFGGTLAVQGGVRPSECFEVSLHDPVRRRTLSHTYSVFDLPPV